MDVAIKVDNVSKVYKLYDKPIYRLKESLSIKKNGYHKNHYALDKISFEVKKGETVGIIGTNGSGKSTLLKIITGVLNPSEGSVTVDGRISALLELGAGFNPEYTGIENIYLNGTMMGYTKSEIESKLESIVEFADIGEFINQPVKTYSSGMFVRLAFAVAINIEPEILIVDEALSVGDVFFQAKCYLKFEEFRKMGKTILLVTHDLGSVVKYCDKVILINKGKFVNEDKPKVVVDIYKKLLAGQLDIETKKNENLIKSDNNINFLWHEKLYKNSSSMEYGSKKAEIIDYAIIDSNGNITNTIIKGEEFNIKIKIRFNEKLDMPIIAWGILDSKGTEITGTNTMIEGINLVVLGKGDIKTAKFNQKMNIQGGEYLLSIACTGIENSELVVYHRKLHITTLNVISSKNSTGFFDMNSKIEIY